MLSFRRVGEPAAVTPCEAVALDLSRRALFLGGIMALAAPAVVRASTLMPVHDPKLVRGILLGRLGEYAFEPASMSPYRHEFVWLHESDPLVMEYRQTEAGMDYMFKEANRISSKERAERPRPVRSSSGIKTNKRRSTNVDMRPAIQASLEESRNLGDFKMSAISEEWAGPPPTYFDRYRRYHAR